MVDIYYTSHSNKNKGGEMPPNGDDLALTSLGR